MDRYLIVSTDGHAGLPMEGYRDYLEAKYHAAFDEALPLQREMTRKAEEKFLISEFNTKWRRDVGDGLRGAWDGAVRNRIIDDDGVAAEVLFPDGITEMNAPPFGAGLSLKPWGVDPELQWAGARAHNRWIAQFCKEDPVRRIGLAIVLMLYDVDAALAEVKWAHDNGLRGILIPALMGDKDAYNHPKYYPVWQFCAEHNMVVHTHSGPSPDYNFALPGAMGVYLTEFAWWASRPMWHLIFGGVFEQFPRLKFVITEVSEFWIPALLELMDVRASVKHTSGKLGDFRSNLTMAPSEYFRRNCWVGASALFDELRNEHEGVLDAQISSAYPLVEQQVDDIVAALKKKYGKQIKATVHVDADLIGGVSIRIGDEVIDASVRGKLAQMAGALKL